ncbi:MAG TPA: hypothetical protein VH186_38705 [Chloroflexia bacterium]|nr:hypothetical protein [Chloroflexia bacterium]
MALYDPALVDEALKAYFLDELKKYHSGLSTNVLPWVAVEIVLKSSPEEVQAYPSKFDEISRWKTDARNMHSTFYYLLEEEAELDTIRPRLPNGLSRDVDEAIRNFSEKLFEIPYPNRVNTWWSVSEEWLHICNAEWFLKCGYGIPLEKVTARHIVRYKIYDIDN